MENYNHNQLLGKQGEDIATKYLESNKYKIIDRNFRCRQGEIDIIAKEKIENEIYKSNFKKNIFYEYVFIEVKTRTDFKYGIPAEAVDFKKQKHIAKSAEYYIYLNKLENENIRFDIIEIYQKDKWYIKHLKNVEIT